MKLEMADWIPGSLSSLLVGPCEKKIEKTNFFSWFFLLLWIFLSEKKTKTSAFLFQEKNKFAIFFQKKIPNLQEKKKQKKISFFKFVFVFTFTHRQLLVITSVQDSHFCQTKLGKYQYILLVLRSSKTVVEKDLQTRHFWVQITSTILRTC